MDDDDDDDASSTKDPIPPQIRQQKRPIKWSKDNEDLLVEWADIAQSYRWMTTEAYRHYEYYHMWFTIPIITLSTITGTASFATYSVPNAVREYAPMAIGTVNILVGILSTIQQYLKISEFKEAYRHAAVSWDKFARNIRIELAKHPDERGDCFSFMKHARIDFDRLTEICPDISTDIVQRFEEHFQERPGFQDMKKPDICDVIQSANRTRHPYFRDPRITKASSGLHLNNLGNPGTSLHPGTLAQSDQDPPRIHTEPLDPQQQQQQNLQYEIFQSLTSFGKRDRDNNV